MIHYSKLIRDKIPAVMDARGVKFAIRTLDDLEYEQKLDEKLHEELQEYMEATGDDKLAELADLMEVIHAIVLNRGYTTEQLEEARLAKREERGAFQERLLLISTGE